MCAWVLLYLECHDRCACGWMDTNGMIPSPAAPYRFIPRRCAACMGDLLAAATTTTFDFCSIGRECDWIAASNFGRCVDASNVWVSCVFSFIHIHNVYTRINVFRMVYTMQLFYNTLPGYLAKPDRYYCYNVTHTHTKCERCGVCICQPAMCVGNVIFANIYVGIISFAQLADTFGSNPRAGLRTFLNEIKSSHIVQYNTGGMNLK